MEEDQHTAKDCSGSQSAELQRIIAELKPGRYTVSQQILDIIDFLPDATFVIDKNKKIIAWNREIEKLTGVKKADIIGKGDYAYAIPFYGERRPVLADMIQMHSEEIESRYQHIEREGDVIFAEAHIPELAGRQNVFLWLKASLLYDGNGNVAGAIESIRDITTRKLTEEMLRKANDELEERVNERTADLERINEELRYEIEERKKVEGELNESMRLFNDIINFLPDATMVIDLEGKVIAWNYAMETTTGVKAEDMLGKGDYEYAIPFYGIRKPVLADMIVFSDDEVEKKQYKNLKRQNGRMVGEAHVENLNGREAYFIATASALHDSNGNIIGAIQTIHDITNRKLTEKALKQAEEKYRGIVHNAVEGIFQTTIEGTFIAVNPAFARIFGYNTPEELIETVTDIGKQMYVDPETRLQFIDMVLKEDKMINFETQCYRADGSIAWTSQSARTVRNENGMLLYLEGFLEDITEQKKVEEESYRTKKLESIGILAGGIAHDFNNMLGAILGNMSFAKMLIDPMSKPFNLLDKAEKVLINASDLTKKLITFSKGGAPLAQPVSIVELIKKTVQYSLKDSGLQCNYFVSEDIPLLMLDEGQIKQVISNIVTNARESMQDGRDINISIENIAVTPKDNVFLKEGRYVKISIEDHGVGIAADDIPKIFDPYFSTKEMGSQRGMGLGLAVCYSIVKNHNGFITVDSEVGRGSTFSIFLPLLD